MWAFICTATFNNSNNIRNNNIFNINVNTNTYDNIVQKFKTTWRKQVRVKGGMEEEDS